MNGISLAKEHYMNAKKDLKRDIKIFAAFTIGFTIAIFIAITLSSSTSMFENLWESLLYLTLCIPIGAQIASVPIGLIVVFRFAWKTFSYVSWIFIVVLLGIAVGGGHIFAIVKFINGYLNIRKLGKQIDTLTTC